MRIIFYLIFSLWLNFIDGIHCIAHFYVKHIVYSGYNRIERIPILTDGKGVEFEYDAHGYLGHIYWLDNDNKKVLR